MKKLVHIGKKEWHYVVVAYSLTCAGSGTALKEFMYNGKKEWHYVVVAYSLTCAGSGTALKECMYNGKKEWHYVVVAYSITCAGSETALKRYIYKGRNGWHYVVVAYSRQRCLLTNSYRAETSIERKVFDSKLTKMPFFFVVFRFYVHSDTILFISTAHLQQSFIYRCFSPYSAFTRLIILYFHIKFFLDSFFFCFAIFFVSMHFSCSLFFCVSTAF
jgi:hypothetical protein